MADAARSSPPPFVPIAVRTMPDAAAIERLRAEFQAALAEASTGEALQALRDRYLGRKGGVVASLMKSVASAAPADRPALGRLANELKREVEARLDEARAALEAGRPVAGAVDVTLPGRAGRARPPASR